MSVSGAESLPRWQRAESAPALLFASDLPPCEVNGGPILMSRLLAGYPTDRLHVLSGSYFLKRFQGGRLACHHVGFPQTSNTGRWGLGRLKQLLEVALFPFLIVFCRQVIRRYAIEVVASVSHDLFFVAAAMAARLGGVPFVLVVHDDWLYFMRARMWVPMAAATWAYRWVLRSAAHIYTVCPEMQQALREEYGIDSEVQLPASEAQALTETLPGAMGMLRVVYAGTVTDATIPTIDVLVKALRSDKMADIKWSLDLYGASAQQCKALGWEDGRVRGHGWRPQKEVHAALREGDLLYLPYSFEKATLNFVHTSFPSKLADYLAAGRPVLICAPAESSVVAYARERGFAELVETPNLELLAEALIRLASSPERRQQLAKRGRQVFATNHDIARQRCAFIDCMARLAQAAGNLQEASAQAAGN